MNKILVIYNSKHGTTKKYAQWISTQLSSDILESQKVTLKDFDLYDTIIFGGALYAGGVGGIKLIAKNIERIRNKKIILFTCGLADVTKTSNTEKIKSDLKKQLTAEILDKIKVFHLRGGIDYSKLSFIHKMMMGMIHKMLMNKPEESRSDEDREMISSYGKAIDFTDKNTIQPLVSYVKAL